MRDKGCLTHPMRVAVAVRHTRLFVLMTPAGPSRLRKSNRAILNVIASSRPLIAIQHQLRGAGDQHYPKHEA
jgi:hypothetical protein